MTFEEIEGVGGHTSAFALEDPAPPDAPNPRRRPILVGGIAGAVAGTLASLLVGLLFYTHPPRSAPAPVAIPASASQAGASRGAIDVRGIVAKVEPAVVSIRTTLGSGPFGGSAAGTGMILTPDGQVLTNAHVVEGADTFRVTASGRGTHAAHVLGTDVAHDVALIKIEGVGGLPTVTLSSTPAQVGDPVVTVGNALALNGSPTVTTGIVSALGRQIPTDTGSLINLLQTDAAINPGDSGGPLLNSSGQVIGMNTAIAGGGAQNIGFAIPVTEIQPRLAALARGSNTGAAIPGYLGVSTEDTTNGALVTAVVSGQPAARAGVAVGDIVTAVDGNNVDTAAGLVEAIQAHHPGDKVSLSIQRNGSTRTLQVTLARMPSQQFTP